MHVNLLWSDSSGLEKCSFREAVRCSPRCEWTSPERSFGLDPSQALESESQQMGKEKEEIHYFYFHLPQLSKVMIKQRKTTFSWQQLQNLPLLWNPEHVKTYSKKSADSSPSSSHSAGPGTRWIAGNERSCRFSWDCKCDPPLTQEGDEKRWHLPQCSNMSNIMWHFKSMLYVFLKLLYNMKPLADFKDKLMTHLQQDIMKGLWGESKNNNKSMLKEWVQTLDSNAAGKFYFWFLSRCKKYIWA